MRGVRSDGRGIVVFDPPVPRGVEFMNTDQAGLDKYPDVRARAFVGLKGFVREHSAPSPHGVVLRVVATRADPYTALVVLRTAEGEPGGLAPARSTSSREPPNLAPARSKSSREPGSLARPSRWSSREGLRGRILPAQGRTGAREAGPTQAEKLPAAFCAGPGQVKKLP